LLQGNDRNWRQHPKTQREVLSGILHEIGIAGALLAYHSERQGGLVLIDGHLRQADYPDQEWPVLVLDVTDAEADLLLATHDPLVGLAQTGQQELAILLAEVQSGEAAVQQFLAQFAEEQGIVSPGVGGSPLEDPEPQVDRAEELRQQWGVERGQVWQLGEHRIICGDATEKSTLDMLMAGDLAQMIFTDPPYGVAYDGGMKKRKTLAADHVGTDIYGRALPVLATYVDNAAPLYCWYADAHAAAAAAAAAAAGYVIVAQIIWAKNHAQFMSSAHYHGKHEPCFYGHKRGQTARWYGPANEVTLWEYDRAPSNDFHPTQKPVPVAARAIQNSSQPKDWILDGFLGGGTTLIACEQLQRRCYGVEIDPGYFAVTLQRWADLTGTPPQQV
jgi:DNA modification methylase